MIEIRPVASAAELAEFVGVQQLVRPPELRTQSVGTIRQLVRGSHPLSASLQTRAFVARRDGQPVGRLLATTSADAPGHTLVGFFESVDDQQVADALFDAVDGPLLGPVDASFWIGYRLKTDGFDQSPFYGEPLNPDWYPALFRGAGFEVSERYLSRVYRPDDRLDVSLFADLRRSFEARGYQFHTPTRRSFDADLAEIHGLISELYADFPVYAPISLPEFRALFGGLRQVADLDMITIARHQGEPVGFQITLPDHGSGLDRGPVALRLARLAKVRTLGAERYISLYSGARREHKGLGKALLMDFVQICLDHHAEGIGALVAEGKVTGSYLPEFVVGTSEHCLFQRP